MRTPEPNPSGPTPVTAVDAEPGAVTEVLRAPRVPVSDALLRRLRDVCAVVDSDDRSLVDSARDWWPIAIRWATRGAVPALPGAVARPTDTAQVAAVLALCNDARVPLTVAAGKSGVCGSSVPAFGGVALDVCGISGIADIDDASLLALVYPGTFGPDLEASLRKEQLTLGHWPQSMDLSTVGGWLACRGAGQYSTRYGKIEDMAAGLEVVLADGTVIRTGGTGPRSAIGPDLTQLFVGSEGLLGVITAATLRLHTLPSDDHRAAYGFKDFGSGLEACRRILRRGASPAVLRLYDQVEAQRNFAVDDQCALIVLDEADPQILQATTAIVEEECAACGATELPVELVGKWVSHRNDVSALAPLYRAGVVVDTIEIAARWSALSAIYNEATAALGGIEGTLAASAHQSHSYTDGACLYFTFGGRMPEAELAQAGGAGTEPSDGGAQGTRADAWAHTYYTGAWDAVTDVVVRHGGSISHHHGIGINRSRFVAPALGEAFGVLVTLKQALDPRGILNPGKLGLPSPFGELAWP